MTRDTPSQLHVLEISEPLFHLATDSVRLHCNETRRLRCLDDLVDSRAAFAQKLDHNPETIRLHLHAVPGAGDIKVELRINQRTATLLVEARNILKALTDEDVLPGDVLSIMLFDYVVEQKANKVKVKLGFDVGDRDIAGTGLKPGADGNVIRLK